VKRRVVMFDVDGVLADFLTAYRAQEQKFGMKVTFEPRWNAYWNDEVWAAIKTIPDWWIKVPAIPDMPTFLRIADLTYAHDLYFVTNRTGVDVKTQTERWLRMRGVLQPTVIISKKKGEMAAAIGADFAIDDKAGNALYTAWHSPKTKSFILDAPWNQFDHDVAGGGVTRVKTVDQFLDEVIL